MLLVTTGLRLVADHWGNVTYSDNKGVTMEDAIVITGATDDLESTKSEYVYLAHHFPGYKMGMQSLLNNKSKDYDLLEFTDGSGTSQKIYFDVTEAFQKLDAEMKAAAAKDKTQQK